MKEQVERESAGEEAEYPRWVRVNAIKSSIEEQLSTTFRNFTQVNTLTEVISSTTKSIHIDPHVPGLLAITQGTDLTKSEAYTSGKLILQDKASCFPAYLLDPHTEDGDVIDACAAPGNKTTHLAAILHAHLPDFENPPQVIYAFEKDSKRAQTLEKMVKTAGSKKLTRIGLGQDFLQVNPQGEKYRSVGALLLDPSCSGSGIVGRDSMPQLHLPEAYGSNKGKGGNQSQTSSKNSRKRKHEHVEEPDKNILRDDEGNETVVHSEKDLEARLEALSGFQLKILLHSFEFPAATKVTYSTCSVHAEENEKVVMRALKSEVARRRGWRILKRSDQVSGMRDWDVRGQIEYCDGDQDVADGCIRSHKGDGRGVMGFFVAGFVRSCDAGNGALTIEDGPYLHDGEGSILRDALGMPVLKSTGAPVALEARDDEEEAAVAQADSSPGSSEDDSDSGSESDSDSQENAPASKTRGNESEDEDGEEWGGFGE